MVLITIFLINGSPLTHGSVRQRNITQVAEVGFCVIAAGDNIAYNLRW